MVSVRVVNTELSVVEDSEVLGMSGAAMIVAVFANELEVVEWPMVSEVLKFIVLPSASVRGPEADELVVTDELVTLLVLEYTYIWLMPPQASRASPGQVSLQPSPAIFATVDISSPQ